MLGSAVAVFGECPSGAHLVERRRFIGACSALRVLAHRSAASYAPRRGRLMWSRSGSTRTSARSLSVWSTSSAGRLAAREFGNEPRAHRALHAWVVRAAPGERRFGVESTGWIARGIACL